MSISPLPKAAERSAASPWLNEAQAAAYCGVGRRKFNDLRQQPWFAAVCQARVLGPRALRWHRDSLDAALLAAPCVIKLDEVFELATARAVRRAE